MITANSIHIQEWLDTKNPSVEDIKIVEEQLLDQINEARKCLELLMENRLKRFPNGFVHL